MTAPTNKIYFTAPDAARLCGVAAKAFRGWKVPHFKIGRRMFWTRLVLERWIATHPRSISDEPKNKNQHSKN